MCAVYSFSAEGSFWAKLAEDASFRWGFLALIAIDLLCLLSTSIVRELCYPLFYVSHVLLGMIFLGGVRCIITCLPCARN